MLHPGTIKRPWWGLLLVLLSLLSGLLYWRSHAGPELALSDDRLRYRHCDFHHSDTHDVHCFTFDTGAASGFALPVALITRADRKADQQRDLVIHIPGGPGQGNMTTAEEIEFWITWLQDRQLDFDLLLYDPRGTGEGKGVWHCDDYVETSLDVLALNISAEDELVRIRESLEPCFAELEARLAPVHGEDKNHGAMEVFATVHQADDVRALIDAFDYQRVHLWGVSYGTRVALAAADHPQVLSLLLDSPYPFDKGDFSEWPHLYHRSFALHQELLSQLMPEFEQSFADIYRAAEARLTVAPIDFYVDHWQSGRTIPFVLNERRLLELSFGVLYNNHLYEPYLKGLHSFASFGEVTDDLRFLVEHFVTNAFDDGFNTLVYFATECVDNRPMNRATIAEAIRHYPNMADYFSLLWNHDVCQLSDFGEDLFVQDLSYPDKPALIFSGVYDPVTPSEWGRELAVNLARARHVEIAGVGHGALFDVECNWSFLNTFLQTQDTQLDIDCHSSPVWP